jgi:hypothetical protein
MKRLVLTSAFVPVMLISSLLMAQDGRRVNKAVDSQPSMDQVVPTEGMWYYLQEMQRRDDPREAIRKRAEFKSQQRQYRLAAQKWFGWSQSRPSASPTPTMGVYSPTWVGNGVSPYEWVGYGYTTTAVRINVNADETKQR